MSEPSPEASSELRAEPSTTPAPLGDHLCYWLRYVADNISVRFNQQLKQWDLSETECTALRAMFGANPGVTHFYLIRMLCRPRSAISKMVARLEARGFVRRRSFDGEVRAQWLSLTAQGEALVPQIAAVAEDIEDRYFWTLAPWNLDSVSRAAMIGTLRMVADRHEFGFRRLRR